ncbi:OTU-domain-containing protein [Sanghuangporus baumii]|uniref:Ubiquitin thioesterase OTU n=1 Tax=Sanghuangporus baumii TaxID=108892 RepID=A0A9Q5HTX3_SANBA|nr:OTU-domain-containing protein [Sanghuangporus baumii]
MPVSKLRLRHPKGQATLELDLDAASVQDLQQRIREVTDVYPSQQELKSGYPPHQLTLIPELPVSSLGLKPGDQIILTHKPGAAPAPASASASAPFDPQATSPPPPMPLSAGAPPRSAGLRESYLAMPSTPSAGGTDYVSTESGVLVHRVVPDDNSCLFSCIALVFEQDISKAQSIRKSAYNTVLLTLSVLKLSDKMPKPGQKQCWAEAIRQDAETWTEAMLGLPREKYIQNILKPSTWGGAIELSILASHYSTEIASIDVETGRIDRFSPSKSTPSTRCILIYSGIHYDAASLSPMADAPPDFHQTVFPIDGEDPSTDSILRAASKLADKLRAKRAYTNTATFDLRCELCKVGLKGEKGAREHAIQTGHTAFGEY